MNRAMFLQSMGPDWLSSIPEVHSKLLKKSRVNVADIGCGFGWSSIGIAKAYPHAKVDGFELDEPSITAAKKNVESCPSKITFLDSTCFGSNVRLNNPFNCKGKADQI